MQERESSGQIPEHPFIHKDERTLRRVQRKVEKLDKNVRGWAQSVIEVLPKGLDLHDEEVIILKLYLAQQHRRNLELDMVIQPESLRSKLSRLLPMFRDPDKEQITHTIHQEVSSRLESDIERTCYFYCQDRNSPALCDPSIDWRVAIRSMAQHLHHIASQYDFKNDKTNPIGFELNFTARDHAVEVIGKRHRMLDLFSTSSESI